MLILDKQKAVERMVALTTGEPDSAPAFGPDEVPAMHSHARTYQRIAAFERRATAAAVPARKMDRRRRRTRLLDGPSPA